MNTVFDFDEALAFVLAQAAAHAAPASEPTLLLEAQGRVLAEDLRAERDQPPFDRVTRDGFALLASNSPNRTIVGEVRAGELWRSKPLGPDDAAEVMTGAPLPAGANAVVMVEHAMLVQDERGGNVLTIAADRLPSPGQNVVPRASEGRAGAVTLPQGTRLDPSAIAVAAATGHGILHVYRRPQVAIIATGDELVELDEQPAAHQIRNSNSYALAALVRAAGGEPLRLPIARDTRADLDRALAAARGADLLLFSGGVSMGKYDLVETALAEAAAAFHFTGVRMQPGKPVVFGSLPGPTDQSPTPFFGLPGNPVSTEVTFHCFVAPLLRSLGGEPSTGPFFAQATLAEAVEGRPGLTRLLPARLDSTRAQPSVRLIPWQGSGDLGANSRANCYAVLPPDRPGFHPGEVISILLRYA